MKSRPRTATPSIPEVRRQLDLYKQIVANSTEAICMIGLDGRYLEQNKAHEVLLGYTDADLVDATPAMHMGPDSFAAVAHALAETGHYRGEMMSRRKDGRMMALELSCFAVKDSRGRTLCYAGLKRDVESRRLAEEKLRQSLKEKEVLLKEVNHRVKNNLQVVSSLLSLQSMYVTDPATRELFRDSQNRIRAMALIHESLYEALDVASIDVTTYFERLGQAIFRSYGVDSNRISLTVRVDPVALPLDSAVPCGLIVNELISNALKYAFVGQTRGTVTLGLSKLTAGGWELVVADDGVGLPAGLEPSQVKSLGLHLVSSLTEQLSGTLEFDRQPGACFRIRIPDQRRSGS